MEPALSTARIAATRAAEGSGFFALLSEPRRRVFVLSTVLVPNRVVAQPSASTAGLKGTRPRRARFYDGWGRLHDE